MKVLHINCNFTGNPVHRTMIEHLSKLNIDNNVFVPVHNLDNNLQEQKNIDICKCFNKKDRVLFDYKSNKIQRAIKKIYDFSRIDIIHAYTLFTDGNVALNIKKKYNIPYVVTIRNTDVNTFFRYMFYLRKRGIKIMEEADAIFFISQAYKNEVFNKYIPKEMKEKLEQKSYIIPNGVDDYWINNQYIHQNTKDLNKKIKIIYVGRIDYNKNIETTQKALNILRNKNYEVEFSIVGKIENKKIFHRIMKYKNTKYFENKPKNELIKLYRDNDIFVMPSFTETFGMVYVEAMSQGLPVIYTKGQGFDKQFQDGKIGYAINPKNPNDIAEKIIQICNNYKTIQKECVKSTINFEWGEICKKYYKIYTNILNAKEKNY